jgi:hypothetical protein
MTYERLWAVMQDIEKQSNKEIIASNQYGMLFLLTKDNGIMLNLSALLSSEKERDLARTNG